LAETTAQINATQLQVIRARPEEVAAHQEMLDLLDQRSDGKTLWRQ
jgi:hypothetical protein